MKPYFVAPIFYLPLQYAVSLINHGYTQKQAEKMTISRFAYFGKHNTKRNKDFDQKQFKKHLNKFLNTENAIIVRRSPQKH